MKNKAETRGRKNKSVDADMFIQLVKYYQSKAENKVVKCETRLFDFMRFFDDSATNFEKIKLAHQKLIAEKNDLSDEQIFKQLGNKFDLYNFEFKKTGFTDDTFLSIRESQNKQIRRDPKFARYSHFNWDDIQKADALFKNLLEKDAKKLMQRLRKAKFQESHKYETQKIGIELDDTAFSILKRFGEKYGIKTHSLAMMIMCEMADHNYQDNAFAEAVDRISLRMKVQNDDIFKKNKDIELAFSRVVDKLIYYSKKDYCYYLSVSLTPKSATAEACKIEEDSALRQMYYSKRIKMSEESRSFSVVGVIKKDNSMEQFIAEDIKQDELFAVTVTEHNKNE